MRPYTDFTDMVPRYAPDAVMVPGHGMQPVIQYHSYPPGEHPRNCPIRQDMTVLELVTPCGSRFYGCFKAEINAELRMVVIGGFSLDRPAGISG